MTNCQAPRIHIENLIKVKIFKIQILWENWVLHKIMRILIYHLTFLEL
jgi:hypothetical protein